MTGGGGSKAVDASCCLSARAGSSRAEIDPGAPKISWQLFFLSVSHPLKTSRSAVRHSTLHVWSRGSALPPTLFQLRKHTHTHRHTVETSRDRGYRSIDKTPLPPLVSAPPMANCFPDSNTQITDSRERSLFREKDRVVCVAVFARNVNPHLLQIATTQNQAPTIDRRLTRRCQMAASSRSDPPSTSIVGKLSCAFGRVQSCAGRDCSSTTESGCRLRKLYSSRMSFVEIEM